ncbi:MAG: ABC transporter ATP-binding protein [Bacilli bacterium]|jgi:ATP-binding cassette subfamily B protein|nr:ABC transporter ATP-binding protein [Bacilli bacterium]MDY0209679.1 ABC transporter ATP-binding protein [Bacilli bacterium]
MQEKNQTSINKIPNYDYLFRDTKKETSKPVATGFFKKIFTKNIGKLILSSLFFIIKASPVWIMPIITANVIDIITIGLNNTTWEKLGGNALVLAILLVQNVPMHYLYARVTDKMLRNNSAGIRATVVRKLQRLSITYHKEMESGRIQSKFLRDVNNVDGLFSHILKVMIPDVIGIIISIGISIYKSGFITLIFFVVVPLNILLARAFKKPMAINSKALRSEAETMSSRMTTMLEMLPVTKAHGLEQEEIVGFETEIQKLTDVGLTADKTNAFFGSCVWVLSNSLRFLFLFFCGYMALMKKISIGDVVLYQSLFATINGYVTSFVNFMPSLTSGMESVRSISEIMISEDIEDNTGKASIHSIAGKVEFKNVSYQYPDGDVDVIHHLNLKVEPGECIAVVGPSGSGKSTIMNLIIGFLKPTSGELFIDENSINDISLSDYRHNISVVPQNSILFSGSIKQNITYGLTDYSEAELKNVLEMANINEFLMELPHGLDTNIGEHGGKLSGGQKQRITIARALIRNPRILILDEATSALDNISEYHVQKAISSLIKDRTTFIVAHRLSTIRNADRILVMENGHCVEMGTYEELIAKQGKFYQLKNMNDITYKEAEAGLK